LFTPMCLCHRAVGL